MSDPDPPLPPDPATDDSPISDRAALEAAIVGAAGLLLGRVLLGRGAGLVAGTAAIAARLLSDAAHRRSPSAPEAPDSPAPDASVPAPAPAAVPAPIPDPVPALAPASESAPAPESTPVPESAPVAESAPVPAPEAPEALWAEPAFPETDLPAFPQPVTPAPLQEEPFHEAAPAAEEESPFANLFTEILPPAPPDSPLEAAFLESAPILPESSPDLLPLPEPEAAEPDLSLPAFPLLTPLVEEDRPADAEEAPAATVTTTPPLPLEGLPDFPDLTTELPHPEEIWKMAAEESAPVPEPTPLPAPFPVSALAGAMDLSSPQLPPLEVVPATAEAPENPFAALLATPIPLETVPWAEDPAPVRLPIEEVGLAPPEAVSLPEPTTPVSGITLESLAAVEAPASPEAAPPEAAPPEAAPPEASAPPTPAVLESAAIPDESLLPTISLKVKATPLSGALIAPATDLSAPLAALPSSLPPASTATPALAEAFVESPKADPAPGDGEIKEIPLPTPTPSRGWKTWLLVLTFAAGLGLLYRHQMKKGEPDPNTPPTPAQPEIPVPPKPAVPSVTPSKPPSGPTPNPPPVTLPSIPSTSPPKPPQPPGTPESKTPTAPTIPTIPTIPTVPTVPAGTPGDGIGGPVVYAEPLPGVLQSLPPASFEANARLTLEKLLDASSANEAKPLIHDPAPALKQASPWYPEGKLRPAPWKRIIFDSSDPLPRSPFKASFFRVVTEAVPLGFPVAVEDTRDGPRIDLNAFLQCRDRLLDAFMNSPSKPAQPFFVVLRRGHYFGDDLTAAQLDQLICFEAASPNPGSVKHRVFIKKSSELGRLATSKYTWDKSYTPVVELTHVGKHVEITAIIRDMWRIPTP